MIKTGWDGDADVPLAVLACHARTARTTEDVALSGGGAPVDGWLEVPKVCEAEIDWERETVAVTATVTVTERDRD